MSQCVQWLFFSGMIYAERALELCGGGWLSGRALLLVGLGASLKAQAAPTYPEHVAAQSEALRLFQEATEADPKDSLCQFFLALQLALARQPQEAKAACLKSVSSGIHGSAMAGVVSYRYLIITV